MPGNYDSQTPAFIIEELNGLRRTLRLTGRALPFKESLAFESSQSVSVTYYPGNPIATSTILGRKNDPSEIEGEWNEKFIGTQLNATVTSGASTQPARALNDQGGASVGGGSIESVRELVRVVDSIMASGALLEVRWAFFIRRGHLRKFRATPTTPYDVKWSMAFEWVSAAEVTSGPATRAPSRPQDTEEALKAGQKVIYDKLEDPPEPLVPRILTQIEDTLGQLQYSLNALRNVTEVATSQAMRPIDAIRRSVSVFTGVVGQTKQLVDELTEEPASYLFEEPTRTITNTLVGQKVARALFVREVSSTARKQGRQAAISRAELLRQTEDDLLAVYTAGQDDDLRNVSLKYYNSPDQWRTLMVFNHLTSSELVRGQVVLVPRIVGGEGNE